MTDRLKSALEWVDARFPLTANWKAHLSEYYAPKNFNFWYYFGSLALLVLVIQIVTGIFLTMNYKPDATLAFASVEYIMRDVTGGWLIRYIHSTGASMFFVVVYLHMFRGLLYGSHRNPRELIWLFGVGIFLCLMGEAFFGYLLPWGQMSYWGAQVIINLFTSIPFVGPDISEWLRGDYVVSDATLNRFFAFHVIALPLVLLGLVVAHIIALHEVGSNNPDGIEIKKLKDPKTHIPLDGIPFHPYYTVKDIVGVVAFLIVFATVIFFAPEMGGYFLEANNFIPANPLVTPPHIAPVWYFTPYYSILRAVPPILNSQFPGVVAMGASVLVFAAAENPHPAIELLLTRGLLRDGRKDVAPPTLEDNVEWVGSRAQGVFASDGGEPLHLYVDGSAFEGDDHALMRAGWAVVQLSADGWAQREVARGVLPNTFLLQTPAAAELYATWKAIQFSCPPIIIHADCMVVVSGFQKGARSTTLASRRHADLWRRVWAAVDDAGGLVTVVHVKAHRPQPQDTVQPRDLCDWRGNQLADYHARAAAAVHRVPAQVRSTIAAREKLVTVVARWIAEVAGRALAQPALRDTSPPPAVKRPRAVRTPKASSVPPHRFEWRPEQNAWVCANCLLVSVAHATGPCSGAPTILSSTHSSHALKVTVDRALYFCTRCGGYAATKVRSLAVACTGTARGERKQGLGRIAKGRHPERGTPIPVAMWVKTGRCE